MPYYKAFAPNFQKYKQNSTWLHKTKYSNEENALFAGYTNGESIAKVSEAWNTYYSSLLREGLKKQVHFFAYPTIGTL